MMAWSSLSSARKVRSITAPVRTFLSLVRTKAPPLPGFTCWNSTTEKRPSGMTMLMPLRRSEVVTAIRQQCPLSSDVLWKAREGVTTLVGHHDGVLDADTADAGEVDAGL